MAQSDSGLDLIDEPSYKRLADISSDKVPVQLDDTLDALLSIRC